MGAAAALYQHDRRDDLVTDRYELHDIGGHVYKFDSATGETWVMEQVVERDYRFSLCWRLVTHDEPGVGNVGADGEGDDRGE